MGVFTAPRSLTGVHTGLESALNRPGDHERGIAAQFPGACHFGEDRPVFEVPLLLIAFTNRSGSSLFGELLVQSGAFGGGGEFLNAEAVADMRADTGAKTLPDHIAALVRQSTAPGQAFAVKASWDQMAMLARWRIPAMFPALRVIHVFRDDTVAQAVSYAIALQTGQWSAEQEGGGEATYGATYQATYRERELLRILETQAEDNARIRAVTSAMGWARMLVCYEALVADPAHHMRQSQIFCGLEPLPFTPAPTRHRRQAGTVNAAHAARLRDALKARVLG